MVGNPDWINHMMLYTIFNRFPRNTIERADPGQIPTRGSKHFNHHRDTVFHVILAIVAGKDRVQSPDHLHIHSSTIPPHAKGRR
jgi:hypothetical protein